MGVTLERVQFKFASIIGELCSEPDVLSQFAVWVDLRLAEYKLKGSISLDCSGDTPDPIWLKGIISALLAKRLAKQKVTSSPGLGPSHMRSSMSRVHRPGPRSSTPRGAHGANLTERVRPAAASPSSHDDIHVQPIELRLSPDIIIKEEPSEDGVYPISLHCHDSAENSSHSAKDHRKRSATESATGDIESTESGSHYLPQTSPKVRRLDPNSAQDVQTSNESLMSIIGLADHSQDDNSSASVDNINSDIDFIMASESSYKHDTTHPGTATSTVGRDPEFAGGEQAGNTVFPDPPGMIGIRRTTALGSQPMMARLIRPTLLKISRGNGKTNNKNAGVKPQPGRKNQTSKNASSAVGIFKRWFHTQTGEETRPLEDISPEELDDLLSEFFLTVKKRLGGEYSPHSFDTLRTSMDHHLRGRNYPCSITRSPQFARSQAAFAARKAELKISAAAAVAVTMVGLGQVALIRPNL